MIPRNLPDQGARMPDENRFQAFLDDISECFIARVFTQWRDRIILPFSLVTASGPVVLVDDVALRENFGHYLTACDLMMLDRIYRRPISFETCPDGTMIGTFETNLMHRGQRATAPYVSSALLHDRDGTLKMSSMLNARGHHHETGIMPIQI